jgi:hypothetical protein
MLRPALPSDQPNRERSPTIFFGTILQVVSFRRRDRVGCFVRHLSDRAGSKVASQHNCVCFSNPKATLDALVPGFAYFAFWYVLGAFAFWFIGFETSHRSIEQIDSELTGPTPSSRKIPAI